MSSEMREFARKAEALAVCVMAVDSYSRDELRVFAENFRDEARALLARTEAGADSDDLAKRLDDAADYEGESGGWDETIALLREAASRVRTHPQNASGDAEPVLFGRDSGGDWYVDADTKSICVDVDFDPARQLSLILKQDGSVAWSIFVQEPDSSTTKATGPSVMNPGFYEALSYIAMQAKEAK